MFGGEVAIPQISLLFQTTQMLIQVKKKLWEKEKKLNFKIPFDRS
jgi:hypothetical protein